jgi:hypothetical protein
MPKPVKIDSRSLWDVRRLDMAFDALAAPDDDEAAADPSWSDVDASRQASAAR